jgi:3-phenylpropionate/trans-cinnamate dioxygenase ferredoxin component
MSFSRVAMLSDVPDGVLHAVETPTGERVCLLNLGGEIRAVSDLCPHQGFPLSAGELLPDGTVECVWHGARFDCRTGAVRQGPATDDLPVYEVRVVGDEIWVGERNGTATKREAT